MAVIIVNELPAEVTPESYSKVSELIEAQGNPDGLIFHSGFVRGGRILVVDAWESHEKFTAFQESRLTPAVMQVMGEQMAAGGPPPDAEVLEPLDLLVR